MKIEVGKYVEIEYTLKIDSGEVVDQSQPDNPLSFIFMEGMLAPGFEKQIIGMDKGQDSDFSVPAEEGYGEYFDDRIQEIPASEFPDDMEIKEGMTFHAETPHGAVAFRVKEVVGDKIRADFNHPLAGETLHFSIKILEVREPTEEEKAALHSCDHDSCQSCGQH